MFEFWIVFVVGAVLSWGVYVPVLHEGQRAMGGGNPSAGALRSFRVGTGLPSRTAVTRLGLSAPSTSMHGSPARSSCTQSAIV